MLRSFALHITMGLAQVRLDKHSPIHFISAVHLFVLQADTATNATPDSQALSLPAMGEQLRKSMTNS